VIFSFVVTGNCVKLLKTTWNLLQSNERCIVTGAMLERANLEELGTKPDWTLTLSARAVNFGAAIEALQMLSLMNFEVESTLATFYAGWTGTQLSSIPKAEQPC